MRLLPSYALVEEALPRQEELEAQRTILHDLQLLLKHKVVVSFLVLITFWVFSSFSSLPTFTFASAMLLGTYKFEDSRKYFSNSNSNQQHLPAIPSQLRNTNHKPLERTLS